MNNWDEEEASRGRRRCHANLRESPEMRLVSTVLVMMTIALMLLALMLLGPAHAKSNDLRSEPNKSDERYEKAHVFQIEAEHGLT
jgi:hypothetical protein